MAVEDMWGSIAHNIMLGQQGIVPAKDSVKIVATLLNLQNEYIAGKWQLGTKQDGTADAWPEFVQAVDASFLHSRVL